MEGTLDEYKWVTHREQEVLVWTAEMQLLDDIKGNFEIGIGMIESGEAERQIIQEEIGKTALFYVLHIYVVSSKQ